MIIEKRTINSLLPLFSVLALGACMGSGKRGPDPAYAPSFATPVAPIQASNGAIFQIANGYAPLTSGARAARVGDLVTIALVERTRATKSNSSKTDKSNSFGFSPPTTGPLALFSPSDASISSKSGFSGNGKIEQSNALAGEISVTIAKVYSNGTMLVRGEKLMTLNRGEEQIRISGIIRAIDIDAYNRVPSNRIANARITYAGSGGIASASKPGNFLGDFFSAINPF